MIWVVTSAKMLLKLYREVLLFSIGAVYGLQECSYYVTFQVESGDRMEFHVTGQQFGLLLEGDQGNLSFQGTRYLGFERR